MGLGLGLGLGLGRCSTLYTHSNIFPLARRRSEVAVGRASALACRDSIDSALGASGQP